MLNRLSTLAKFIILTIALFVSLSAFLIFVSKIIIQKTYTDRVVALVNNASSAEIKKLKPADFSQKDPKRTKQVFANFFEKIKTQEIIRIKVWDYSAKVIFSDDQSIIGQRFADNEGFQNAIKGKIFSDIEPPVKTENVSEKEFGQLLEVYVPITFNGESIPSGVIEIYFRMIAVDEQIAQTETVLLIAIISYGLLAILILTILFREIIYKQIKKIDLQALALDNVSDHVIITDLDGYILYVNKAAEKLTGYSKKEMIGNRPSLWGNQMPKEFYEKMWKTIKVDKKAFEAQITNRRKNGEEYIAEAAISPVLDKNDNILFFIGLERDITHEKEVDQAKTEFVSLASHQLRTPLTAIKWYSEMLLAGDAGKLNDEQKKYLEEVYEGNHRMIGLVNSLLNVSRLEMGTFTVEPKPTDIVKLAKDVVLEQTQDIQKQKLALKEIYAEDLPKINVDPSLLRMIFQNLLSNAVKYTPEKGSIIFTINKKNGQIQISVSDTGLGIPKKQQDKIFTKLFRADNIREKYTEGSGLGLYIVKSIIDHSSGKVWFESEENKGTTFYVSLPLTGMKKKEGTKTLG